MKKTIKIISISFAVILILLVISPFIVATIVDPNDYKDEISTLIHDKTGRILTIKGEINYSLFPWLGLSLGELQLSNSKVKGFSKVPFAQIKSADVRIKIMPLLSSTIEIDKIVLSGLNLSLEKNKHGISNWQDLIKKTEDNKTPKQNNGKTTNANVAKKASDTALMLPAIAGIELLDATINWHDRQLAQQYQINNFNFTTGVIANNTPTNINIQFAFKSNQPTLSGNTTLTAKIEFNIEKQSLKINDLELIQSLTQKLQHPNNITLKLNAPEIEANIKTQTASITKLQLSALNLDLTGSFKATKILSDFNISGNLSTNTVNPKELLTSLKISLPKMADNTVLEKAKLDISLSANSKKVSLSTLAITFDDTKLTGNLSLANFTKPKLRYQLHIDDINIDRYFPAPPKKSTAIILKKSSQKNSAPVAISLPLELLRSLDVKGSITLGKTTVSKLHSTDIKLSLFAKNGILRAYPISAKMYQGKYSGDITLNVQKKVPVIILNESISNVSFQPLVIDYLGKDYLSGHGTAHAKLTTKGLDIAQFTKNLNGTVSFNIRDSKIKYLNVKYRIKKEIYKFINKPFTEKERFDNPNVFKVMKGSFQIKNGVAHNRDFITESRDVNLNGKGYVDLVNSMVNYDANIIIQRDIKTGNKTVDKELHLLTKRPIPTPIKGPFTNISVKPKVLRTLRKIHEAKLKKDVKKKIDKEKQKQKQKLKAKQKAEERKLKEKLKNKLKDLFK